MIKTAVVTGASYGLGKAICDRLLADEFKVYGVSRSSPPFKSPQFVWIKADLTHASDIAAISTHIKEKTIDLLVNNAGTAFEKPALDFTDEDFAKMYTLNFVSPIKLTRDLFPKLVHGLIINISSVSDRYPDPLYGLYGSTKAALNIYFETIAEENKNVKVINVLPSYIDTPLQHAIRDSHKEFDWDMPMRVSEVSTLVPYIIGHAKNIETGSRIIVASTKMGDMSKNPEKLYVYNVDSKTVDKVA